MSEATTLVVSPVILVKHYTFARIQFVPLCVCMDSIDYLWCVYVMSRIGVTCVDYGDSSVSQIDSSAV